jgi:hypothetical protein
MEGLMGGHKKKDLMAGLVEEDRTGVSDRIE